MYVNACIYSVNILHQINQVGRVGSVSQLVNVTQLDTNGSIELDVYGAYMELVLG